MYVIALHSKSFAFKVTLAQKTPKEPKNTPLRLRLRLRPAPAPAPDYWLSLANYSFPRKLVRLNCKKI